MKSAAPRIVWRIVEAAAMVAVFTSAGLSMVLLFVASGVKGNPLYDRETFFVIIAASAIWIVATPILATLYFRDHLFRVVVRLADALAVAGVAGYFILRTMNR